MRSTIYDQCRVLQKTITALQGQTCRWPPGLDTTIQEVYELHNRDVLSWLSRWLVKVLELEDRVFVFSDEGDFTSVESAVLALENFLASRWEVMTLLTLSYTFHAFLPANQACLNVAEIIETPGKSVCQLLMPTVSEVVGNLETTIRDATEDKHGHFHPQHFLLTEDGLVDLLTWFESAKSLSNEVFSEYQRLGTRCQFHLSDRVKYRVRTLAMPFTAIYYDALLEAHALRCKSEASVGSALADLIEALHKSSERQKGTYENANKDVCRAEVQRFYDIWRGLSEDKRDEVGRSKANGTSLESYLLRLFPAFELEITQAEQKRMLKENTFDCTACMSGDFRRILHSNLHLYGYGLDGSSESERNQLKQRSEKLKTKIDSLTPTLKSVLDTRKAIKGEDTPVGARRVALFHFYMNSDVRMYNDLAAFEKAFLDQVKDCDALVIKLSGLEAEECRLLLSFISKQLVNIIGNLNGLAKVLFVLPAGEDAFLMRLLDASILDIFRKTTDRTGDGDFVLGADCYGVLMKTLSLHLPRVINTVEDVIATLRVLPKRAYPIILGAMQTQLQVIFVEKSAGQQLIKMLGSIIHWAGMNDVIASEVKQAIFEAVLPIVLSQQKIDGIWNIYKKHFSKASVLCCFWDSLNKDVAGLVAIRQTQAVEESCQREIYTPFQASVIKLRILAEYVGGNQRNEAFCRYLKNCFVEGFFRDSLKYMAEYSEVEDKRLAVAV